MRYLTIAVALVTIVAAASAQETPAWRRVWSGMPHAGVVKSFDWGPGGLIASMGDDEFVRVVEAASGKERWAFELSAVQAAAFSEDGKRLAAGGSRFAVVWDLETGKELDRWILGDYGTRKIAIVDGGTRVITLTHNGRLGIREIGGEGYAWGGPRGVRYDAFRWRQDRGAVEAVATSGIMNHSRSVKSLRVDLYDAGSGEVLHSMAVRKGPGQYDDLILEAPQLLARAGRVAYIDDGRVVFHDAAKDEVIKRYGKGMRRLAMGDGDAGVTLTWDGALARINLAEGEHLPVTQIPGAEDVTVSRDGRWALVQRKDDAVLVDVLGTGRFDLSDTRHVAFAGDGKHAVVWPRWGGDGALVRLPTAERIHPVVVAQIGFLRTVAPGRAAFDATSRWLASMERGKLRVRDLRAGDETTKVLQPHRGSAGGLKIVDDRWVTTFNAPRNRIRVLDLRGPELTDLDLECSTWDHVPHPAGRALLTRVSGGEWRVHGLPAPEPLLTLPGKGTSVPPRMDARGKWLACVRDGRFTIYDLASGDRVPLPDAALAARAPLWSPAGANVAVSIDGKIGILGIPFDDVRVLDAPGRPIDWSPDGSHLLVGGRRTVAGVIDVKSGALSQVPDGITISSRFQEVKLGVGGRLLAVTDCNLGAWVHDLSTGREVVRHERGRGHFVGARFSPTGHQVLLWASSGDDVVFAADGFEVVRRESLNIEWTPDGTLFAAGDGKIDVWGPGAREPGRSIPVGRRVDAFVPNAAGTTVSVSSGPVVEVWKRAK